MTELEQLNISTLSWLHHHGDSVIKKTVTLILRKRDKGEYKRVR